MSRYSDPHHQMVENYQYLFNLRPDISKSWCSIIHLIPNISDQRGKVKMAMKRKNPANVNVYFIVGFTLTVVNEFCRFLSQFSTNIFAILHTLFSIHVVTTLKISYEPISFVSEFYYVSNGQTSKILIKTFFNKKWLRIEWGIREIH